MGEGIPISRAEHPHPFERGELVKLKDNLDPRALSALGGAFVPEEKYLVFFVQSRPHEGGDAIYLAPLGDFDKSDAAAFEPILIDDPKYRGKVLSGVPAVYFRRVGDA